jgi:hypothetical protein
MAPHHNDEVTFMTTETHDHTARRETMTAMRNPMSQKTRTHKHTAQVRRHTWHPITSHLRQVVSIHRAVVAQLLIAAAVVSVLAGGAPNVNAEPTITAVLVGAPTVSTTQPGEASVALGNFALQGSGFTPGNTRVNVWLTDFSTNQLLWYTPEAYAFPNGMVGVTGPMQYTPPSGGFSNYWSPAVSIPCGHNVRAIAKDGDYEDTHAMWTPVSDNISPPCPIIQ